MNIRLSFWIKSVAALVSVLTIVGIGAIPFVMPAAAAYACPNCYGLEKVSAGLIVERGMSIADRQQLEQLVSSAKNKVAAFYGSVGSTPTLLVCQSSDCDRRTGGRGALGETYLSAFIRMSPRGIDQTFLAHELSHAELHARVGILNYLQGKLPAWVDEGTAVIVSEDERYLKPDAIGAAKCRAEPVDDLRPGPFEWGRIAAKSPFLYAQAACRVLRWMDANGGRSALLAGVIEAVDGRRKLLE